MPVPTSPTTAVAGQPTRASLQFNALAAQVAWLISPPLAVMRATVGQSIASGAFASLLLDTEDLDRDGGHSTVSNTSRYTAVTAGWYEASGQVQFAFNATGRRGCRLATNGTTPVPGSQMIGPATAATGGNAVPSGRIHIYLNVGDYLEVQAFQDAGGALLTAGDFANLNLRWVSS